jgi:hypothetical protein
MTRKLGQLANLPSTLTCAGFDTDHNTVFQGPSPRSSMTCYTAYSPAPLHDAMGPRIARFELMRDLAQGSRTSNPALKTLN